MVGCPEPVLGDLSGQRGVHSPPSISPPQENEARKAAEQRHRQRQERVRQEKKKRRSIATCSAQDPELLGVELDLLFLGTPRSSWRGHSLRGPPSPSESPQGRDRLVPLSRRHTLTVPTPCHAPLTPACPKAAPHSKAKRAGLFGQGLRALLTSPPARASGEPHTPRATRSFCLPTLFQRSPASPQGSPQEGSGLAGFFRRLSVGEKPQSPSQS